MTNMTNLSAAEAPPPQPEYAAFVSLDWADQEHAWALQANAPGAPVEQGTLKNTPEAVEEWTLKLRERFGDRPLAVALEQRRGALIAMLSKYSHIEIYPIHPSTLAHYRQGFYPSGAKSDPGDTRLQLELLVRHRDRLSVLRPDTVETRQLQFLTEQRRKRVDDQTAYSNELTSWLKQIFPQALGWFKPTAVVLGELLGRWPTLEHLQKARKDVLRKFFRQSGRCKEEVVEQRLRQIDGAVEATRDAALRQAGVLAVQGILRLMAELRRTIAELDDQIRRTAETHPDFPIVKSFPGAGAAMAPRLLAALGTQRDRFGSAGDLQCYTGIAPVVSRSGQQSWIHWRWACPKFIRQTFHEWAQHSLKKCAWAQEYYRRQREEKKKSHHAALRALAFKWLRILYRCWKDRRPYEESRYLESCQRRAPAAPAAGGKIVDLQWKKTAGFLKLEAVSS